MGSTQLGQEQGLLLVTGIPSVGRVHIFMITDQKRLSFLLIIVKIEVLNTFIDFEFLGVDLGCDDFIPTSIFRGGMLPLACPQQMLLV